ncbi:MAG: SlyX family protein [Spirochaetaceae bacterium]|nr:SlyX family protein [Spirochaetaceae bacterium]RKX76472.1 MAG: hypothetical protein DRP60_07530 [Spirochaetota bacterium]RKX90251.1 MAG: hypothetical protein DRP70_01205 [Spirochaetota bacterium]
MQSDYSTEIQLMHLEDQINRMNLVLADQGHHIDKLTGIITSLKTRLKLLEEGSSGEGVNFDSGGPSEIPPDGVNR